MISSNTMSMQAPMSRLFAELAELLAARAVLEKNSIPVPHRLDTTIWAFQQEIRKRLVQEMVFSVGNSST